MVVLSRGVFRLTKKVIFRTYPELIDLLQKHNLQIEDYDRAIEILKSKSYYNIINRYKEDLYKYGSHTFREGTSLDTLYQYHQIEDELRNILFRYTINLEQRLKENMAYVLSAKYGVNPDEYLKYEHYRQRRSRHILCEVKKILVNTKWNPVKYYRENYDFVPAWILLNDLTFGKAEMFFRIFSFRSKKYVCFELLSIRNYWKWISNNLTEDEKEKIDNHYRKGNTNYGNEIYHNLDSQIIELVTTMINTIHIFRNNLAHGVRLTHFRYRNSLHISNIRLIIKSNKTFTSHSFRKLNLGNGIFGIILSLILLLDKEDGWQLLKQLRDWQEKNHANKKQREIYDTLMNSCKLRNDFILTLKKVWLEKYYPAYKQN